MRVLYRPLPKTPQCPVFRGVFSCQSRPRHRCRNGQEWTLIDLSGQYLVQAFPAFDVRFLCFFRVDQRLGRTGLWFLRSIRW